MAVQRGNAIAFLEGHDRALHAALAQHAASAKRTVGEKALEDGEEEQVEEEITGVETTEDEEESEEEEAAAAV